MIIIFWTIMLLGLAGAAWRIVRTRGRPMFRIIDALVALSAAGLAFMLVGRTIQIGIGDWNDAKLAPVVAMKYDYALYQDPQTGVLTGWIYGPIGALLLFPAALAKDPTTCGLIGSAIASFCFLAPAMWLFVQASGGKIRWLTMIVFFIFAWRTVYTEDLCRSAFIASPDAPALGLGACACALIYHRRTWLTMLLSALCAVLCIWTKQNFIPIAFALLACVAINDGWKMAGRYAAMLAGIGLIVSVLLLALFGAANMRFHMLDMPRAHPFQHEESANMPVWVWGAVNMILASLLSMVLVCLVGYFDSIVRPQAGNVRQWFVSRRWPMLLVVAVFMLPASMLGYAKVGGFVNNLACTNYYLVLAGLCGVLETVVHASDSFQIASQRITTTVLGIFCLTMAYVSLYGPVNGADAVWKPFIRPYDNPRAQVFEYSKTHPNEVYCPWNPLITLMSDGKLYHFEWGLLDRYFAKKYPTAAHFTRHVPALGNMIVYTGPPQSTAIQSALPVPFVQVNVPEMPGCVVYARK